MARKGALTQHKLWSNAADKTCVPFVLTWKRGDKWAYINVEFDHVFAVGTMANNPGPKLVEMGFDCVWEAKR